MEASNRLGEVAAHDAAAQFRPEDEKAGDCEQDAGDGGDAVGDARQERVTLNESTSGHVGSFDRLLTALRGFFLLQELRDLTVGLGTLLGRPVLLASSMLTSSRR